MSVSFGKIRIVKKVQNPSPMQQNVVKYALKAFAPNEKIPFRYGKDPMTGLEYSLDEAIEKVRGADVYITYKKNGNVGLKVVKQLTEPDINGKVIYYIPCESYENRLQHEINARLPLTRVLHQLNKFARRCEYYVRTGNTGINKRLEAEALKKA